MLRPRRHDHQIPSLDILILPIDCGFAHATRKRQCLVNGVHFIPDIATDGDGH
jgi:hypothetical protein